jgi:hypothetical protein
VVPNVGHEGYKKEPCEKEIRERTFQLQQQYPVVCSGCANLVCGTDIVVIGDASDTKEEVMSWYEKNK